MDGSEVLRGTVQLNATEPSGAWRYWVFATNDLHRCAVELESEHRHKANVEAGMRELKSNFGLGAIGMYLWRERRSRAAVRSYCGTRVA